MNQRFCLLLSVLFVLSAIAAQTALADTNRNGTVDRSDVVPVAVDFEAQYMDVSDGEYIQTIHCRSHQETVTS